MSQKTKELIKLGAKELMSGLPKGTTARGQIREILIQVKQHGGYSIFWITENPKRASIATDMVEEGLIYEDKKTGYPWCSMKINYDISDI